jgi:type II secretory pathway component PulL
MTLDQASAIAAGLALLIPLIIAVLWDSYVLLLGKSEYTICNQWRRWNVRSGYLLAFLIIAVVLHVLLHWSAWCR